MCTTRTLDSARIQALTWRFCPEMREAVTLRDNTVGSPVEGVGQAPEAGRDGMGLRTLIKPAFDSCELNADFISQQRETGMNAYIAFNGSGRDFSRPGRPRFHFKAPKEESFDVGFTGWTFCEFFNSLYVRQSVYLAENILNREACPAVQGRAGKGNPWGDTVLANKRSQTYVRGISPRWQCWLKNRGCQPIEHHWCSICGSWPRKQRHAAIDCPLLALLGREVDSQCRLATVWRPKGGHGDMGRDWDYTGDAVTIVGNSNAKRLNQVLGGRAEDDYSISGGHYFVGVQNKPSGYDLIRRACKQSSRPVVFWLNPFQLDWAGWTAEELQDEEAVAAEIERVGKEISCVLRLAKENHKVVVFARFGFQKASESSRYMQPGSSGFLSEHIKKSSSNSLLLCGLEKLLESKLDRFAWCRRVEFSREDSRSVGMCHDSVSAFNVNRAMAILPTIRSTDRGGSASAFCAHNPAHLSKDGYKVLAEWLTDILIKVWDIKAITPYPLRR